MSLRIPALGQAPRRGTADESLCAGELRIGEKKKGDMEDRIHCNWPRYPGLVR